MHQTGLIYRTRRYSSSGIISCLLLGLALIPDVVSAELYINPAFINDDVSSVADLNAIVNGAQQPPGEYLVDLYLNEQFVRQQNVTFVMDNNNHELMPCFTVNQLTAMGINVPTEANKGQAGSCPVLTQIISGATSTFEPEQQKLSITVPQVLLQKSARDSVPVELWNNGISAFTLNYDFSGSSGNENGEDTSAFLNLQSGLNLGAWRLRDYSTLQYSQAQNDEAQQRWQHINTYLQRPLPSMQSMMTFGDNYTQGKVFDSVNLRGAQLTSDDNMLPDSQKGFAPSIHGIAKSNAQVTVRQKGYVIYQTAVSPGAFTLDDLYPVSDSGDLDVSVKESDGSISYFSVPYAAVPTLQREGHFSYSLAGGRFIAGSSEQNEADLMEATLFWGGPLGLTPYGGLQISQNYRAVALGAGVNLGQFGALSADLTWANSVLSDGADYQGRSLRFMYAKSLAEWGTRLQVSSYRYSTQGFYDFEDTTWKQMQGSVSGENDTASADDDINWDLNDHKRARLNINISQPLGTWGSLYFNGSRQTYWQSDREDRSFQWGYSTSWNNVTINLSGSLNQTDDRKQDRQIALNLSLPIGSWLPAGPSSSASHLWLNLGSRQDSEGQSSGNLSLNGDAMDGALTYNLQQTVDSGEGNASSARIGYKAPYGEAQVGLNHDNHGQWADLHLSGGLVAHEHGVIFSQHLQNTNILVEAPGAAGLEIENVPGVKTDSRGYAIIPGGAEYRHNRVAIRPDKLSKNVELDANVTDVVPTEGAIVKASFVAHTGMRALITLLQNNDKPVPFGATVTLDKGEQTALVGDEGAVYLTGLAGEVSLTAVWGQGAHEQCTAHIRLPESSSQPLLEATQRCQ